MAAAAYHFGAVLEGMLGSVKKYELWVLGALLVLGLVLWLRRRFKNARLAKQIYADEQALKRTKPKALRRQPSDAVSATVETDNAQQAVTEQADPARRADRPQPH